MISFTPTPGTGDLYSEPYFVNAGAGNFSLQAYSELISAAEYNYDMGAVPYTVRPIMPGDLQIDPSAGAFQTELSWINPSVNTDGSTLDAEISIIIYRNGDLIATLPGQNSGQAGEYLDNVPASSNYRYTILAHSNVDGLYAFTNELWIGPPAYEQIPYQWVEISGIGVNTGIIYDDQNAGPFDLGFSFPWYEDTTVSQLYVCSNGFASFSSTATSYINMNIPNSGEPNDLIAPYWDDLNPAEAGAVYYYQDAANNRFIVQWDNLPHFGWTGANFSFEMILNADGSIEYMYQELDFGIHTHLPEATVGIENSDGTLGCQITYNNAGPLEPTNEIGIRINPVNPSTGVLEEGKAMLPAEIRLEQNYPNPFNPQTLIRYALPRAYDVALTIYDISGRQVAELMNGWQSAGWHEVEFDGSGLASGLYVYRLQAEGFSSSGKMVLLK
ncbi:MAG: T9SS type A sorting domain-containing protein [bacterium]